VEPKSNKATGEEQSGRDHTNKNIESQSAYEQQNETENEADLDHYKGIYFNDKEEQEYYEGGAHFSHKELCMLLEKLYFNIPTERRGKQIYQDSEFLPSSQERSKLSSLESSQHKNNRSLKDNKQNINTKEIKNLTSKIKNLEKNSALYRKVIPQLQSKNIQQTNHQNNKFINLKLSSEKKINNTKVNLNNSKTINSVIGKTNITSTKQLHQIDGNNTLTGNRFFNKIIKNTLTTNNENSTQNILFKSRNTSNKQQESKVNFANNSQGQIKIGVNLNLNVNLNLTDLNKLQKAGKYSSSLKKLENERILSPMRKNIKTLEVDSKEPTENNLNNNLFSNSTHHLGLTSCNINFKTIHNSKSRNQNRVQAEKSEVGKHHTTTDNRTSGGYTSNTHDSLPNKFLSSTLKNENTNSLLNICKSSINNQGKAKKSLLANTQMTKLIGNNFTSSSMIYSGTGVTGTVLAEKKKNNILLSPKINKEESEMPVKPKIILDKKEIAINLSSQQREHNLSSKPSAEKNKTSFAFANAKKVLINCNNIFNLHKCR
jgi:hypothetical protein